MANIWTLMIFAAGQVQGIVLQFTSHDRACETRDKLNAEDGFNKVTVADDFGRELSIRPNDAGIILLQDIDQATEGNMVGNVKNNVAQAATQVRTQGEIEKIPEIKAAMLRQQFQGAGPVIRQ